MCDGIEWKTSIMITCCHLKLLLNENFKRMEEGRVWVVVRLIETKCETSIYLQRNHV